MHPPHPSPLPPTGGEGDHMACDPERITSAQAIKVMVTIGNFLADPIAPNPR
jgi:hypothetical protein